MGCNEYVLDIFGFWRRKLLASQIMCMEMAYAQLPALIFVPPFTLLSKVMLGIVSKDRSFYAIWREIHAAVANMVDFGGLRQL